MTIPMVLGLGMTASYLLLYLLKPRSLRKWFGIVLLVCAAIGLLKLSCLNGQALFALLITVYAGSSLIAKRDQFTRQEDR